MKKKRRNKRETKMSNIQFADVSARLKLESRIRDGARNMLQILDASTSNDALRGQVERELAVAEEQVQTLNTRRKGIENTLNSAVASSSRFRRPRAIRAVHGLEDLNTHAVIPSLSPDPFALPESQAFRLPASVLSGPPSSAPSITSTSAYIDDIACSACIVEALTRILQMLLSTRIEVINLRDPTSSASAAQPKSRGSPMASDHELCHLFLFLSSLYQQLPDLRLETDTQSLAQCALLGISLGALSMVRAYAMRLLRYILSAPLLPDLATHTNALPLLLCRALTQEASCVFEREQSLKLVRACMHYTRLGSQHAHTLLTVGVVRVLAAIAVEPDDPLCSASIETLAELALLDTPLVARSSAMAPLWRAVCETPADVAVPLVTSMLMLLDRPTTRRHISAGTDLASVLAGFTSVPSAAESSSQLSTTQQVVSHLLLSWQGLFYLCMCDMGALRSLVASLYVEDQTIRRHVLAALLPLFRTVDATVSHSPMLHVRVSYVAFALMLLLDAGLWDALLMIMQQAPRHDNLASELLDRILAFSRDMMPQEGASLHACAALVHRICVPNEQKPELMVGASHVLDAVGRSEAVHTFSSRANQNQAQPTSSHEVSPTYAQGMYVTLDDAHFRTMLRDSMVITAREHTLWNQPVILELLDHALWDPKRFDEALNGSKFIRRLLAFFRPAHMRYASMKKHDMAHRWTAVGVSLCRVLLYHADGVRVLVEEHLLSDLRDSFEQLGQRASETLFSLHHLQHNIVTGYFEMLQVLSASAVGLELLTHARLFTPLMCLCENEDDASVQVVCSLLAVLDVSAHALPRVFLERALSDGPDRVREAATKRVGNVLWLDDEPQPWAMSLLLTQLYDPSASVRTAATNEMERACAHPAMAQCAMQQGPPVDLLATHTTIALLGLADSRGFQLMHRAGLLSPLAQAWYARDHIAYVAQAERVMALDSATPFLPPHLYGQLAKTPAGCVYLAELHVLPEWSAVLAGHALESFDSAMLEKVKAALWACGHVGASDLGMSMLQSHDLVDLVFQTAKSPVVSIRGTFFFVCGLWAHSEQGRCALTDRGWDVSATAHVCLPRDFRAFVYLPGSGTTGMNQGLSSRLTPPKDEQEAYATGLLANLGNGVVAGSARRALLRHRQQHPRVYRQVSLLGRALHMMDHFAFRLAARRSIWAILVECPLTPDTIRALQQWRSMHLTIAPVPPTRRSQKTQSEADRQDRLEQGMSRLYPVLRLSSRQRQPCGTGSYTTSQMDPRPTKSTTEPGVTDASLSAPATDLTTSTMATTTHTTYSQPSPQPCAGRATRDAWPYKMHGFV